MTNLEKVLQYAKLKSIHLYEPTHKSQDKTYEHLYKDNEAYRTSVNCIGVTRNNSELWMINDEFPEFTRLETETSHVWDLYISE